MLALFNAESIIIECAQTARNRIAALTTLPHKEVVTSFVKGDDEELQVTCNFSIEAACEASKKSKHEIEDGARMILRVCAEEITLRLEGAGI